MSDNHLENSITSFLQVLAERMRRNQRADEIQRPARGDLNDTKRYFAELKAVYDDAITDLYQRIEKHGRAVLQCSDDEEIAPRVQQMLQLAAQEGADMRKLVAGLPLIRDVGSALAVLTVIGIWFVFQQLPRQRELDQLTLDLSAYCLLRFPPSDGRAAG